ncbi:MAG: class I SAM-dependent methyltransferase, partial [Spirillospora sp.]
WLEGQARLAHETRGSYRVLDVGCGGMPYRPFFAPYASEYVGVDIVDGPDVLVGPVESLPVPDASFDVVLCNQVLEHCDDPPSAVRELARVVAPGGRVLASTHGVQVYHPSPQDLWRWTHAGLERLFAANGGWHELRVEPGAGTAATVGMLVAIYVELLTKRTPLAPLGRAAIGGLNAVAEALDARAGRLRDPTVPGTVFANFHVTAVAPPGR